MNKFITGFEKAIVEPSTWAGLGVICGTLSGVAGLTLIAPLAAAACAVVAMFLREGSASPTQPVTTPNDITGQPQ